MMPKTRPYGRFLPVITWSHDWVQDGAGDGVGIATTGVEGGNSGAGALVVTGTTAGAGVLGAVVVGAVDTKTVDGIAAVTVGGGV